MQLPSKYKSWQRKLLFGGLVLIMAVISLLGVLDAASTPASSIMLAATIGPRLPAPVEPQLPELDPTSKAHSVARQQTEVAHPLPTGPVKFELTILPTQRAPTGIRQDPNPPGPSAYFLVQNAWQDYINGSLVQVFAGVNVDDPSGGVIVPPGQGTLLVNPIRSHGTIPSWSYKTPTRSGPARITAANGTLLTVTTTGGDQFLFDVMLGQYFNLAGTPLTPPGPTSTALPTPSILPALPYPEPIPSNIVEPPILTPLLVEP